MPQQRNPLLLSGKTIRTSLIIVSVFLFFFTFGCAADDETEMNSVDQAHHADQAHSDAAQGDSFSDDVQPVAEAEREELTTEAGNDEQNAGIENEEAGNGETERKIIREQWLKQQVQDLNTVLDRVEHTISQIPGAYIESLQEWQHEEQAHRTEHHAQIIMRVPHDEWDALEKDIEEQGIVQHRQVSGTDVTEEYIDNEAQLRNLQAHEERILDLYDEANTVEEMLEIEEELSRIRGNIEEIEGRQHYLDHTSSTVKVTLELFEVEEHEYAGAKNSESLWNEARLGFQHSAENLLFILQRMAVWLVASAPYLIVVAVIGGSIFFGRKMYLHGKKKNG